MKKIITLIVLCIASHSLMQAQENFKQSLSGIKHVKIDMDAKINLVAGSGNELIISENKNNNQNPNYGKAKTRRPYFCTNNT